MAYKDNDTITIGAGKNSQETTTLKLTAVNEAGNKTAMTYIFRKQATLTGSIEVTFVKPDSWGDKVYAYVYDETTEAPTVIENAAWPGVEMEHVEGNNTNILLKRTGKVMNLLSFSMTVITSQTKQWNLVRML